jgi:hypothetical protein
VQESYLLQVFLTNSDDPVITLHEVLQAAFGWANCHGYSFSVSKFVEEDEVSFSPLLKPLDTGS